jgi:hypothetical protein
MVGVGGGAGGGEGGEMTSRLFVVSTPTTVDRLAGYLKAQLESCEVPPLEVKVGRVKRKRTVSANARYWLLTDKAAEIAGYTSQEMHEQNCGDFFGWRAGALFGQPTRVPARTTTSPDTLDSKAFNKFASFAEQRYSEFLGVWLEDRK